MLSINPWPPWAHSQVHTHTYSHTLACTHKTHPYTCSYAHAHIWCKTTSWKSRILAVISYNQISYQFQFLDELKFREILKACTSLMPATFWVCVSCFRLLVVKTPYEPLWGQNCWPCVYSLSTCLTHEERGEIIFRPCVLCCFILVCSWKGKAKVFTRSIGYNHPGPNTKQSSGSIPKA